MAVIEERLGFKQKGFGKYIVKIVRASTLCALLLRKRKRKTIGFANFIPNITAAWLPREK